MRCAMAGMVSLQHISKEFFIPFQAKPCDICGRKSGTETQVVPLLRTMVPFARVIDQEAILTCNISTSGAI